MFELFESHGALLESWLSEPLLQALRQPTPSPEALAVARAQIAAWCERAAPFAPSLVIDNLEEAGGYSRIAGRYLTGSVLTAEVVGLAALSSRMAADGRQDAEVAGAVVSRLLGALFDVVYVYGGGVLKAGGDTLTAFFDARRLGDAHGRYAAAAALALQACVAELHAETEQAPLRLRVAAHSGRVLAVEVGDRTHTELLVTGHAISRMARALLAAGPGEVVVTDKLLQLAPGADAPLRVAGQHVLLGLAEPPTPVEARRQPIAATATLPELVERLAALQPYAPQGLSGRLAGVAVGSGEFRPVTVMMANFCAFNRVLDLLELPALIESDPTIVGHVLNTYYTRIQAVIQRYGGAVGRIDLAPYGDRFVALFGAPTAHEDDPARAVQTALTVRAELSETNQAITSLLRDWAAEHPDQQRLVYLMSITMRQRVGIAGGNVFAGIVGAPERHEYTVIGQPVHLAARLLAGAEDGETLLADETARAVGHLVAVEDRPPVLVDAGARPSAVFRAIRPRFDPLQPARLLRSSAPLIGRNAQLEQALGVARAALEPTGGGRVLALVGAPGVGKTRLADEMLRALRGRLPSAAMIHETCQSYDEAVPYGALARLVRRLLYVPASADRVAQARAVQEQVAELLPAWARFVGLLGPLLGLPIEESDASAALGSDERRERLHELVVALCQRLATRQPLVLVLDDLQWSDASTRTALLRVADELQGRPILLLALHRPDAALVRAWQVLPHATTITLGDLSRAESEALLDALLDGRLPDELHPLVERAHGTPLYIEETVRFLLDTGVLARDGAGQWFCTRSVQHTIVPSQIEQIVVSRLDQLGSDERDTLEVAAVIGRRFSQRLLDDVLRQVRADHADGAANGAATSEGPHRPLRERRPIALRETLDTLVCAEILLPDESALEPTYTFRHALIRDVTYGSVLFARRHLLHARVAEAIERLYAGNLEEFRAVLAQHELHAGRSDRALPHLVEAARHAQARYANDEALALYRQALAIAPQHDQTTERLDAPTAALYENLGEILALTGDYATARSNYEWLLRVGVAEEAGARVLRKAALQRRIGATYEQEGNLDLALTWFERAAQTLVSAAVSRPAALARGLVLSDIGWVQFRRGTLDESQRDLEQAVELLEAHHAHEELARVLNRLGGVAWSRGELGQARHYVERSLAACEQVIDLTGQAHAFNNLGILAAGGGQSTDAVRFGQRAMELFERVGNRRQVAIVGTNVGYAYYDLDSYEQAHAYFLRALTDFTAVRDQYGQMRAHLCLARTLTALAAYDQASEAVRECQQLARQLDVPAEQVDSSITSAEIALYNGAIEQARTLHREALAVEIDRESEEFGRLQRLEARIALVDGDRECAVALLEHASELFVRLHNMPEADRTRRLMAELEVAAR